MRPLNCFLFLMRYDLICCCYLSVSLPSVLVLRHLCHRRLLPAGFSSEPALPRPASPAFHATFTCVCYPWRSLLQLCCAILPAERPRTPMFTLNFIAGLFLLSNIRDLNNITSQIRFNVPFIFEGHQKYMFRKFNV